MAKRNNVRTERGQAMVEFALTIVFVMLLIVGALELIVFIYTYSVLADSAKEGVRYAIVHGSKNGLPSGPTCPCVAIDGPPAPSGVTPGYGSGYGVVRTFARYSLHDTSTMTVSVTYPDAVNTAPNRIRVVVSYVYQPFFGLGWPTMTVHAASEGRIAF